ncbi:transposase [Streptomyces sp. NPDC002144]
MGRGDLTNGQWARLEPLLPRGIKSGRPPVWTRRQSIDGIRWRTRTGAPWRDVPERYGPWERSYDLFRRWQRDGTWARVVTQLQAEADAKGLITWTVKRTSPAAPARAKAPAMHNGASSATSAARSSIFSNERTGRMRKNSFKWLGTQSNFGGDSGLDGVPSVVGGEARPVGLVVEELLQAGLAAALAVEELRRLQLGVEIVVGQFPGRQAGLAETDCTPSPPCPCPRCARWHGRVSGCRPRSPTTGGESHARLRRLVTRFFNADCMAAAVPLVERTAREMLTGLRERYESGRPRRPYARLLPCRVMMRLLGITNVPDTVLVDLERRGTGADLRPATGRPAGPALTARHHDELIPSPEAAPPP